MHKTPWPGVEPASDTDCGFQSYFPPPAKDWASSLRVQSRLQGEDREEEGKGAHVGNGGGPSQVRSKGTVELGITAVRSSEGGKPGDTRTQNSEGQFT